MTEPKRPRAWNLDPVGNTLITPEQARRAALAVAAAYPHDPLVARHLLDALGLLELPRPGRDVTSAPAAAPVDAADSLVDTTAAADAVGVGESALHRYADAKIVAPARVDPDGSRWWNLREVRGQIATYLANHPED